MPAPVFGIVVPRTLDEPVGAGAADPVSVGDADTDVLGDADGDPPGNTPPLPELDGDGDADALGEVCACSCVEAAAADVINTNSPAANDITASTPSTRGIFRMGRPPSFLYVSPVALRLRLFWAEFSCQKHPVHRMFSGTSAPGRISEQRSKQQVNTRSRRKVEGLQRRNA
jgi:hypothetical protein